MKKEFGITAESAENGSVFAIAVGALPDDLHKWFTTSVLSVGNSEREVSVSRYEYQQLIESAQTWIAVNQLKELEATPDFEALMNTLSVLERFMEYPENLYLTFSNLSEGDD